MRSIVSAGLFAALSVWTAPVAAEPLRGVALLEVFWEALWSQDGVLGSIRRWDQPIRLHFKGPNASRLRGDLLPALREIAEVAGVAMTDIDAEASANFVVESASRFEATAESMPCQTTWRSNEGTSISRVVIRVREDIAARCIAHEAMHAMGFAGHPSDHTVLSYYRNSNSISDTDRVLLKLLYSDKLRSGMSPILALSRALDWQLAGLEPEARSVEEGLGRAFVEQTLKQVDELAQGAGEPPRILYRSSRMTNAGMAQSRIQAQYYLGLALVLGEGIKSDPARGIGLLKRAAEAKSSAAQFALGFVYEAGRGVDRDPAQTLAWYTTAAENGHPGAMNNLGTFHEWGRGGKVDLVEAFKWYSTAAGRGVERARTNLARLRPKMTDAQIEEASARSSAWNKARVASP